MLAVLRYLVDVNEHATNQGLSRVLHSTLGARASEAMMTLGEQLRAEGREEGREEGAVLGQRDLLHRMVVGRFGVLPEPLAARLASATLEQIDRWANRLVTAATVDAIFADDP